MRCRLLESVDLTTSLGSRETERQRVQSDIRRPNDRRFLGTQNNEHCVRIPINRPPYLPILISSSSSRVRAGQRWHLTKDIRSETAE